MEKTNQTVKIRENVERQLRPVAEPLDHYDVIVAGVGSMGSAACYYLAKAGHKVLGLEQFNISHDQGSHSGQSRIIRKAYFEHPDYVPLLERAYANWAELQHETGISLYYKTGFLYFGRPDHFLINGVHHSARKYGLKVQDLSAEHQKEAYPQFRIPNGYDILLEPDAGFLLPERAILTFVDQALQYGANVRTHEKMLDWQIRDGQIEVRTTLKKYYCSKLIIAAGPWASNLIPQLEKKLTVTKQTLAWVQPKNKSIFDLGHFPCWTLADENSPGLFYGFPYLPPERFGGPIGLKVAHHSPGVEVDPDRVDRHIPKSEEEKLVEMMYSFIPEGYSTTRTLSSCLYTYTPDTNFVLGPFPKSNDVIIAGGFSGHGFKFACVIGEILADLAVKGTTPLPIGFLSPDRFMSE